MSVKYKNSSLKSEGSTVRSGGTYVGGGSADITGSKLILPLNYGGLGYRFYEQFSIESDKVNQVDTMHNITETKRAIKTRSVRLAIEMQQRGIGKNDIILISSKTHCHQTIVLVATLFLGGIVCPINPEAHFKECLELVRKLKPKMCFCDSRTVSQIDRILYNLNITSEIVSFGDDATGTTQFCKLFPFKEDTNFKPFFIDSPHKEVAFIIPTQGTCNEPKLVCLSHHNIYVQCSNFMNIFENPSKVISFFPLSWLTQTVVTCAALEYGFTLILAPTFQERIACKMIHDFQIDVALLGTELATRLTGNVAVKDFNLNCLKYVMVGVVNTSMIDMYHMKKILPNVKFLQLYSITETGFISAVTSTNFHLAMEKSITTVGKLVTNCKIKIVHAETKLSVGMGQVGELYFTGDGLMLGYFKNSSGTITAIDKGYFKTGDLAKYDEEGWIYLVGRIEDLIIFQNSMQELKKKAEKNYPKYNSIVFSCRFLSRQMEECITSHPQVHDSCVIGNENELIVCVQKKPESKITSDNIMMFLAKRLPEFVGQISSIIFLDEFPRTSAGNIKKRLLREQYLKVKIEYTRSLASISPSNNFDDPNNLSDNNNANIA